MKNVSAFIVLTAALGMLLFFAYPKEISCEDCIGNNHPSLAVAGPDQVITLPRDSMLLDGSKSSDPDGKISAWQWTKIKGPASLTIVSAATAMKTENKIFKPNCTNSHPIKYLEQKIIRDALHLFINY